MARKLVGETAEAAAVEQPKKETRVVMQQNPEAMANARKASAELQENGLEEVTITLAAEKYAPVQYHSFDVGPFMVRTRRRPGETLMQVYERVMPELRAMSDKAFHETLPVHLARVKEAATSARGGR